MLVQKIRCAMLSAVFGAASLMCAFDARAGDSAHHHGEMPADPDAGESMPFVRLTDDGLLHMVYVSDLDGKKTIRYRQMFGATPVQSEVSPSGINYSHWPESPPLIEVTGDRTLRVLYTVRISGSDADGWSPCELRYTTSTDTGRTWSAYRVVGDTAVQVYRSCASMREDASGRLVLSWLEAMPGKHITGVKTAILDHDTFEYSFADERTCECCGTELIRASDGAMWLAYRNVDERNVRDMYLARMLPDETRFGPSRVISRDNWAHLGCPDTGPRFTLGAPDHVWVAWYTGKQPYGVYAAHALNSKPTFSNREVVQGDEKGVERVAHPAIGTLPDGRVFAAYECKRDGVERIEGRARLRDAWSAPIALGGAGEYPRIVANSTRAVLVYTAIKDGVKSISVEELGPQIPSEKL